MAAEKRTISIGPVRSIPKGTYNPILDYEYLNIVKTDDASYICRNRLGAPSGINIEDEDYWQRLARDGQDGAVSFATQKEYENEVANKAISPALIKPILDEIETEHTVFEKYGTIYNSSRLEGKTLEEVRTGVDAAKLEGNTLSQVFEALNTEGSMAANGWVKLANGLLIQWGSGTATYAGAAVTLPTAFPTKLLWSTHTPYFYMYSLWSGIGGEGSYQLTSVEFSLTINAARTVITLKSSHSNVSTAIKYLLIGY